MTDRQIEMHWYCGTCHHDNRGRDLGCANCGKPRENEEYLMPSDTRSAPSVTDPALLKQATAGANWSCKYCRSSRRNLEGNCARCGAPSGDSKAAGTPSDSQAPTSASVPPVNPPRSHYREVLDRSFSRWILATALALIAIACGAWMLAPRGVHVVVQAVSWSHSVEIERYRVTGESGWYSPGDAFEVRDEGPRLHHYDHRAIGSHSEAYSVQVTCGETCASIPKSCHESCTSNKNGYATCRTSCSGGGQSCSPRYCSETRHRQVTDYQDFPIYQDWYSWKVWRWLHQRDIALSGRTTETRWPTPLEEHLGEGLADHEDERQGQRHATYKITYKGDDDSWQVTPTVEGEFRERKVGSRWRIEVNRLGMVLEEKME